MIEIDKLMSLLDDRINGNNAARAALVELREACMSQRHVTVTQPAWPKIIWRNQMTWADEQNG